MDETYNSDSSDSSIVIPSSSVIPEPSPANDPAFESYKCEGKPGVYSAIWCLCYKTSKLKRTERKGGAAAGSNGRATLRGATKGGGQRWSSLATVGGADVGMHDGEGADADRYGARPDLVWA